MSSITIPVTELRPDDQYVADGKVHYTVISWPDVFGVQRETRVDVRFPDGGTGTRVWDEGLTITVERPGTITTKTIGIRFWSGTSLPMYGRTVEELHLDINGLHYAVKADGKGKPKLTLVR